MPLVPTSGDQQPWWASTASKKRLRERRSGRGAPPGFNSPESGDITREVNKAVKKRKAGVRRRQVKLVVFTIVRLVLAAILVYGLVALFRYPGWRLSEVEIQGLSLVDAEELKNMLPIRYGGSLIFLNSREIENAAMSHPRIKSARVHRNIPSSLLIQVTERQPYLDLVEEHRHIIVDSEGMVIDVADEPPETQVKTLRVRDAGDIVLGQPLPFDGAFDVLDFNKKVDPRVRERVTGILITGEGELIVYTDADVPLKLDIEQDWSRRLDLAPSILDRIENDGLDVLFVDLRPKGAPYIRLKPSPEANGNQPVATN